MKFELIKTADDLGRLRPNRELESAANVLLYGHPDVLEEAMFRQVFWRRIYVPVSLSEPLIYRKPKYVRERLTCGQCRRLRSDLSAALCCFCYRLGARLRYFDKREGLSYWESQMYGGLENGQRVGITMPVTEWWQDSDVPAVPKRVAFVDWN